MASNAEYSILAKVVLDLNNIQSQLNKASKSVKFDVDTKSFDSVVSGANKASEAVDDLGLTFNVANQMFQKSIDLIGDFVDQVYTMNSAVTEFKKVSDLRGSGLEDYVQSLSEMGKTVARTGKPNRSEPE